MKKKKNYKRKTRHKTENGFLQHNAEQVVDSLYSLDRCDNGCGGGRQKPKHKGEWPNDE